MQVYDGISCCKGTKQTKHTKEAWKKLRPKIKPTYAPDSNGSNHDGAEKSESKLHQIIMILLLLLLFLLLFLSFRFHRQHILCKRTHKLQNNASILQINQLTFKCCWNVGVKVFLRWNMWITCRHSGYSHTFGDFIWSKATFCFAIHTHTHNIRLSNPIEFHSAWKVAEGGGASCATENKRLKQ